MSSRKLDDLHPEFREKVEQWLALCKHLGLDVLVYCTLRPGDEQARLFRQGRSLKAIEDEAKNLIEVWQRPDLADILMGVGPQTGKVIRTNSSPGKSLHQYGVALDAAPLQDGRLPWYNGQNDVDNALWAVYGSAARQSGLVWGGDWDNFQDQPHVQMPKVRWQELIKIN